MILEIKVTPKAKFNKITKISDTQYYIYTTAVPEKGKANKEIIKILSKELNTAKSNLKIIGGQKAKNKLIQIDI